MRKQTFLHVKANYGQSKYVIMKLHIKKLIEKSDRKVVK